MARDRLVRHVSPLDDIDWYQIREFRITIPPLAVDNRTQPSGLPQPHYTLIPQSRAQLQKDVIIRVIKRMDAENTYTGS
ncbi:MAG: hypothetical protein ABWZ80_04730 [Beijerinckiaceae bacterium]